ncbi:MAG: hypothetical protein V9G19_21275 [Tetrasphaera sp.]
MAHLHSLSLRQPRFTLPGLGSFRLGGSGSSGSTPAHRWGRGSLAAAYPSDADLRRVCAELQFRAQQD